MKLSSKELFEAVRREYPDFSTVEVIAFVQAEYLARIANGADKCNNEYISDLPPRLVTR